MASLPIPMLKRVLCVVLYRSGLLKLWFILFRRVRRDHCAIILMYHRIVDTGANDYLFKNASVHHDVTHLRKELSFLNKSVSIISMDELVEHVNVQMPFQKPTVVLTFDDGYRDNYELAFPLLRRYSMPAIVYVTTGLTGTKSMTWADQLEFALLMTKEPVLQVAELTGTRPLEISTHEQKCQVNIKISKMLKKLSDKERRRLIPQIFECLGVRLGDMMKSERSMLNESEIREMCQHGIDFGSHTETHPILSLQSYEQAVLELERSKRSLEKLVGNKITHFAIPNGQAEDFTEPLKQHAQALGYESIVTTEYGCVSSESDRYFLRRTSAAVPIENFACSLAKMFWSRTSTGSGNYGIAVADK